MAPHKKTRAQNELWVDSMWEHLQSLLRENLPASQTSRLVLLIENWEVFYEANSPFVQELIGEVRHGTPTESLVTRHGPELRHRGLRLAEGEAPIRLALQDEKADRRGRRTVNDSNWGFEVIPNGVLFRWERLHNA
jgi:hypothetical protein